MPTIAVDTETTGLDFRHGARPFYVNIAHEDGSVEFWEWEVDPLTRAVSVPKSDLAEIEERLRAADTVVFHNAKFDLAALTTVIPSLPEWWDWEKTHDTLYLAHLLGSNLQKNLTALAVRYLGIDIEPYETALDHAVAEARRSCRRKDWIAKHGEWRIAKQGLPEMPSAKEKCSKFDLWLPCAVAKAEGYAPGHPWWTVLQEYANPDPTVTLALFGEMSRIVRERKLERIAETRRKLLPVVFAMEQRGVSVSPQRIRELIYRYGAESEAAGDRCIEIARGYNYDLTLPKSGNNKSLTEFCFGRRVVEDGMLIEESQWLALPVVKTTDTGAPSLDKSAMESYLVTLDGERLEFVEKLVGKRSRDTGVNYLEAYSRFWIPRKDGSATLYPSLNVTGTDTLRCSSQNPNAQNVSKKENFNLRYGFGPAPGREWWCLDASNIELRLPAYESGEKELIELFENPDAPPYYGSNHLLVFSILHPDKWAQHGKDCKKVYASTWYQWTKNGNFAVQYGAVDKSDGTGTADRAYRVPGAQARIAARFRNLDKLNRKWIDFANRHGYVETIPDKTVDPNRGYPVLCTRTEYGRILETVPLNYHTQSSAMWWMGKAMIRCHEYLRNECPRAFITMQVHDELVFDFPAGKGLRPWMTNAVHVREIRKLMEQGGADFGIPTPVNVEYCADHWDNSIPVKI